MENVLKNQLFNYAIDTLFDKVNVSNETISQIFKTKEIINFFYFILNEFGSNPNDIREIFENSNPKNNNLNMIFNENAQNLLSGIQSLNFLDIFINYIKFSINSVDLSYIQICYNTCKKLISQISKNITISKEKIDFLQKCIYELCFNCPNIFPYNDSNINIINDQKRRLIIKESFYLFKLYI